VDARRIAGLADLPRWIVKNNVKLHREEDVHHTAAREDSRQWMKGNNGKSHRAVDTPATADGEAATRKRTIKRAVVVAVVAEGDLP